MAARIVCEGAAGGGGNLFEGKKIWLSHRVPLRSTYKEQVESNGGVVVLLEKNADIIIVDHARRDCPPGSISWKWIEQSIRNGRMEDIENHRAGPPHAQTREVGSAQPTKKTRTPFSADDDRILMQWVTRAERKGLPILGNAIYQQLAEKYPHHTWQSWLDRWKRYVSAKKRPLPDDENEDADNDLDPIPVPPKPHPRNQPPIPQSTPRSAPPPSIPPHTRSRPKPQPKLPPQASVASPVASEKSQNSTRSLKANPFILKSLGGDVFTNEESELLFDAYNAIMNLSDDQVIDAWIAWSMENPNHTPQEWRNHFKEYVVPTKQARLGAKKVAKQSKEMPPPKKTPARVPSSSTSTAIPVACKVPEIEDSQGSSGQTIPTPAKQDETTESYTKSSREFEESLLILADELELDVDPNPVIRGKTISLFALWQVVRSDEFGGYEDVTGRRLWGKVARKLDFDRSIEREAGIDLQACYSEILCDLENAEKELRGGEDIRSSQEAELIADQLRQTAQQPESLDKEEEQYSSEGDHESLNVKVDDEELLREREENDDDLDSFQISPYRPQPSSLSAGKRSLSSDRRRSDLPYNKRQRINKGKGKELLEIPSTPEDIIKNTQISRPAHRPSPLKYGQAETDTPSTDSSIQDIQPMKLVRQKPAVQKHLEPETQDFYHPVPTYPQLPDGNIDDEDAEDELIPALMRGPSEEFTDEAEGEEESLLTRQVPPSPLDHSPFEQNVSNATTRETLHSLSNNVSSATTRGTLHASNNNYESSTQSQTESQTQAKLAAFIDKHVADGFPEEIIIAALEATCTSFKEALKVMDRLANGDGIPEDMPGAWTSWDDEALVVGRGTAEYDRIVRKHGISRIRTRKIYLTGMAASKNDAGKKR
ncbi:hypothetical protein BKA65DRAFT_274014 [Rhexocercosporidium sp. MPI-PUGE-AT-0058]|nr:hypothetical protein BKA65DRAFT_274014 [Rhexocercosporidium sp. MPI-PUGE-AT-0058]